MADVDNGLHDDLVATAEPDEEANRRCSRQISAVLCLILAASSFVVYPMYIYYSLTVYRLFPPWFVAVMSSQFPFIVGIFWSVRRSVWRNICDICSPEKEWQIDAEGYLN
jgi:hypothetical protein